MIRRSKHSMPPTYSSYKIHMKKLGEIKGKKSLTNSLLIGSSILNIGEIPPLPKKKVPSFYSNRRQIDIYIENQNLVRRIGDINKRTKTVFPFSLNNFSRFMLPLIITNVQVISTASQTKRSRSAFRTQTIVFWKTYYARIFKRVYYRLPSVSKRKQDVDYEQAKRYKDLISRSHKHKNLGNLYYLYIITIE